MNACRDYAALLDGLIDGELTEEETLRVREHLRICPSCRAYVEDALAIRAEFPSVEDTEVPEGFAESVTAAIRAETAKKRKKRAFPWLKAALPLAACCAIVILLAQGPLSSRQRSGGAVNQTAAPESVEESAAVSGGTEADTGETEEEKCASEDFSEDAAGTEQKNGEGPKERENVSANTPAPAVSNDSGGLAEESETEAASPPEPVEAPAMFQAGREGGEPPEETPAETGISAQSDPEPGIALTSAEEEGWVEYGNVVFACVVYLPREDVGDALDGYEGKPYSNANYSEEGVMGTGYALEQEDFERILEEVGYFVGPMLNQDRTTELNCIVVTEE